MSNIQKAFENGKAFIPFLTCGDPDLETTAAAVKEAVKNGADMIELGIPFSDPTAEGPLVQEASLRALQCGITTDQVFEFVKELRREVAVPLIFVTYANVIFSYGTEKFMSACRETGIDGLLVPDVPFEEKEEFQPVCSRYGVDLIPSVAPTSKNRTAMIAKEAEGFIYIVSSLEAADDKSEMNDGLAAIIKMVRENSDLPCAVGLGISSEEQARKAADISDGVVVGSAIVELLAAYGKESPRYIGEYVRKMKNALKQILNLH